MAKGELSEVKTSQRQTKVRRVLQSLQVSADEQGVKKNMVNPKDEIMPRKEKQLNVNKELKLTEKENVTAVRRSKRKTAAVSAVNYVESPEVSKTAKSSAKSFSKSKKSIKSKKGCSTAVKKNEQTKLNQTKLQFSPAAASNTLKKDLDGFKLDEPGKSELNSSTTEITEDSGFDPNCGFSCQSPKNSTAILKSPDSLLPYNEVSILTEDTPPLSYWRSLAEQRRIALDRALHENELLHDQLTVLEAENSQLKQLVREAEHVVLALKAVVE